MEILFLIVGFVWVLGWVKQLAEVSCIIEMYGLKYPSREVERIVPIVLFFTWPYFYFYGKAR